jgi:hypothetical protein
MLLLIGEFFPEKSMCMAGSFDNRDRVVEKGKEEVCGVSG